MKVALEPFARTCIEDRFGLELTTGTQAALRHYARRLRSNRQPIEVPGFRRGDADPAAGGELELSVPGEIEATLRAEASRQGVSLARLVSHAVFVYLADLDSPADRAAEEDGSAPRYRVNELPEGKDTTSAGRATAQPALPQLRGRGSCGARARGRSRFGER